MGYYANGSGDILIRSGTHVDKIRQALSACLFEWSAETVLRDGKIFLNFDIFTDEKYRPENVEDVLCLMEPYTVEGCLQYYGEDGAVWRYIFLDGHFVVEYAEFYYDKDICEIRRRAVSDRITPDNIQKAEQVLIDNGISADEAQTVLQAIGYALLDFELYPQE